MSGWWQENDAADHIMSVIRNRKITGRAWLTFFFIQSASPSYRPGAVHIQVASSFLRSEFEVGKRRNKLSMFTDYLIIYIENLKQINKQTNK